MNKLPLSVALVIVCGQLLAGANGFAQGPLTPQGVPTPSMKSLDQIEARTPISSAPFTISVSGSYYLTKNLSVSSGNAISITANGVTLDLNGFTISSTAASAAGYGILLNSALRDSTILNGHIRGGVTESGGSYGGSGSGYGISYTGVAPGNTLVSTFLFRAVWPMESTSTRSIRRWWNHAPPAPGLMPRR